MKILTLLLLSVLPLSAQPTNLTVIGATNRQAVIAYNAPSGAACTIALTENGTAAHDTNNSLFSGANSDLSRSSTISRGRYRIVTLGKPNSDLAADGKLYSRALFAETYYTGTVTCGSGVNFSFATSAPPVGGLFAEPPPVNTDGWGQHGFPSIDYTEHGDYADPITGVRISPITLAGGYVSTPADPVLFGSYTGGSGWTNPGNILAYSATTSAQVGNTNPLVVWPSPLDAQSLLSYGLLGNRQLLDFGLFGYAGGSSGTAVDRQFTVCLTIDGTNCMSGSTTITAQAVQDADPSTLPQYGTGGKITPNFPTPFWSDWGKAVPMDHRPNFAQLVDFIVGGASVSVASGVVTVSTSGAIRNFQSNVVGKQVYIADSSPTCTRNICTIASFQSGTQVTLAETGLTVSNKSMYLLAFGIKIQKVNANGTLNLSLGYKGYGNVGFSSASAAHTCHPKTFTNFDGERTRLCIFRNVLGNMLYAVTDSRKGYYLGIGMQSGSVTDQPTTIRELHFDRFTTWNLSDAKSFYVITETVPDNKKSLFRVDYSGDGEAITNVCGVTGTCVYVSDGMTWTNLGKGSEGNNIQARALTACGTKYSDYVGFWGSFDSADASRGSGDFAALSLTPSSQDGGPGWELIINVADATINKCIFTMDDSTTGMRFASHHAFTGFGFPEGQLLVSGNPLGRCSGSNPSSLKLCGPWQATPSHVWRSGAWSNDTSLPWPIPADNTVYDRTCPGDIPAEYLAQIAEANPVGDPTTKCVTIRSQPPCFLEAIASEISNWPCPHDPSGASMYQLPKAGDYIQDISLPDAPVAPDSERLLLLKDPVDLGDGTYSMVFARNAAVESCNPVVGTGSAEQSTHADNWTFMMGVTAMQYDKRSCIGAFLIYDANTEEYMGMGKTISSGHTDFGRPVDTTDSTKMSFVTITPGSLGAATLSELGDYPPPYFSYVMTGFNATGESGVPTQSYMKRTDVENTKTPWAIDAGNAAPFGGSSNENPINQLGTRSIALEAGTSNVYKIGVIGNLRNEKYAPMWYWSGFYSLRSVSSAATGDVVTDATEYVACRAYKDDECRTGSTAGEIFVSVPNVEDSTTAYAGQSYMMSPVAVSGFASLISIFRRGMRQELNCDYCQILSYAWPSSGVHYPYQQAITDPNGVMGISSMGGWMNGTFQTIFGYKLPSWTPNSSRGNKYQTRSISVPARAGTTHARIRFGRDTDFYCIPSRNEACVTDTVITPFAWVTSDAPTDPTECDEGCTITIPVTTGVYYFKREWLTGDVVVATGSTEVITVN